LKFVCGDFVVVVVFVLVDIEREDVCG
jgi:hypothetical protein